MNQNWIRILGGLQVIGAVLIVIGSGTARFEAAGIHYRLPLLSWLFATVAFSAGVLLLRRQRGGVVPSFIVQCAQAISFNAAWRYVFLAGAKLTWVVASVGTGIYAGGGGTFVLIRAPNDGTLSSVGLAGDVNFTFMLSPLENAHWAIGINLVAIYFARRLWRLHAELSKPTAASAIEPGAV